MSITKRIIGKLKHFNYHGGLMGIVCHYLNPQRLQGSTYRFPKGSPERERRLKWISHYHRIYSQTAKVLLGANAALCMLCIKISMASPLK